MLFNNEEAPRFLWGRIEPIAGLHYEKIELQKTPRITRMVKKLQDYVKKLWIEYK